LPRTCAFCGSSFEPHGVAQKYCVGCRERAYAVKNAECHEKYRASLIERQGANPRLCARCGKALVPPYGNHTKYHPECGKIVVFESVQKRSEARRLNPRPCKRCGGAIPLPDRKHQTYCAECRGTMRESRKGPLRAVLPKVCKHCGKEFVPGIPSTDAGSAVMVNALKAVNLNRTWYCSTECSQRAGLLRKYNLTGADYNRMFNEQGGCCAICGKHQKDMKKKLAVDHDHETGEVRALLCGGCNTLVGRLEANPERVEKCHAYLARHQSLRIAESA